MYKVFEKSYSQFLVVGLGRFGMEVTKTLYELGKDVLAIDINEDRVNEVVNFSTHAIIADASEEGVLEKVGLRNFEVAIICTSNNLETSILTTMLCKQAGLYVVVKAKNDKHKKVLEKIGADQVLVPEAEIGHKVATMLTSPRLSDVMELTKGFVLAEIALPPDWSGKTLLELDIRKKYGVSILIVKRGNEVIINPEGSTMIKDGDYLIVGGEISLITKFTKKIADLS